MKSRILTNCVCLVFAVVLLSGCDKDILKALVLDGTWTGYLDTYYQDRYGVSGSSFRTAFYFEQENLYGGWGYEVDFDSRSRLQDYYYCEFTWRVNDGTIYLNYSDSWNTVRIYDYSLSLTSFSGYMDDGTNREIHFDLSPSSDIDWDYYRRSWRTRGAEEDVGWHASGIFKK